MPNGLRAWIVALGLSLLTAFPVLATAAQGPDITFAVLSYRPKPVTQKQWEPLVDYLNQALPGMHVSVRVLNFPELEQAVNRGEIDVVLTNSVHYVQLSHRHGLDSPIATLVNQHGEVALHTFGSVVLVLASRQDLRTLEDLRGKRIATPGVKSFGGYLMAAYELQQAGLPQPTGRQLLETGMPHDTAVEALLAGKADAAFVRTSVLERMEAEGRVHPGQLRVIHPQTVAGFPLALSTRLYPEWPVAVLPHVDKQVAGKIAAALLTLPHQGVVARQAGIHGFSVPTNYQGVVEVLQALRQPPFEAAPIFSGRDVWRKYEGAMLIGVACCAVILALLLFLLRNNRELRRLRAQAEVGDRRLLQFSQQLPGVLYQYHLRPDGTSHYPYVSERVQDLFGLTPAKLDQDASHLFACLHPDDLAPYRARIRQSADTMKAWRGEYRVILPDGSIHWREGNAWPQLQADGGILWHGYAADIDDRKLAEARTQLLVAALEASANSIVITDVSGRIEWVNPAFCALTGYASHELIGQNSRLLKSGVHDAEFYGDMWRRLLQGDSWRSEITNRRKDGSLSTEELIITPVENEKGEIHHFIGIKQDIAERKRMIEELQRQAKTDMLTGLANRRCFFHQAESELARIKRGKAGEAVLLMLDIDHFKQVNDTYGHAVGDGVLVHLAGSLRVSLRRSDLASRLGGEEFALLLPETTAEQGLRFAERLRSQVAVSVAAADAVSIGYTVSLGLAMIGRADKSVDVVLARADSALYRAKQGGRNRVESTI